MGAGEPEDILDYHEQRGTFVNTINERNLPRQDFLDQVRAKWDAIKDDTAAVLLAIDGVMGDDPMYVYTCKSMWMRTSCALRELHPTERAAMMDATFKVGRNTHNVFKCAQMCSTVLKCFVCTFEHI